METNFEQLLEQLGASLKSMANTETVMGETFTLGEFSCKPVMRIGLGFGSGAGAGDVDKKAAAMGNGAAAGAGIGMTPMGFLVSNGDRISYIPAGVQSNLQTVFDKVPDLVDKIMDINKARNEGKEKKEGK